MNSLAQIKELGNLEEMTFEHLHLDFLSKKDLILWAEFADKDNIWDRNTIKDSKDRIIYQLKNIIKSYEIKKIESSGVSINQLFNNTEEIESLRVFEDTEEVIILIKDENKIEKLKQLGDKNER